jgi:DNA-binding response OmpR family regulator
MAGFTMRILLVEDDIKIASFIIKGLKAEGFAVDHAPNGVDGLHLALTEPYAAGIIDIMLPQKDGLSLIEEMRREKIKFPVIILSARAAVDDRVKGLQIGGDDYLTKPQRPSDRWGRLFNQTLCLLRIVGPDPGPDSAQQQPGRTDQTGDC